MLQINHLTIRHARDLRPLLEDFSFTLNAGDRAAMEAGGGQYLNFIQVVLQKK